MFRVRQVLVQRAEVNTKNCITMYNNLKTTTLSIFCLLNRYSTKKFNSFTHPHAVPDVYDLFPSDELEDFQNIKTSVHMRPLKLTMQKPNIVNTMIIYTTSVDELMSSK